MNSKQKGKRGERAACQKLREHGYEARRGQQFKGTEDSPDIECEDLSQIHFEVKNTERINIYDFMEQAIRDAGKKLPCVMVKRNHQDWLVTFRFDDIAPLLSNIDEEWYVQHNGGQD